MTIFFEDYTNSGIGRTPKEYGGEEIGFIPALKMQFQENRISQLSDSKTRLLEEELSDLTLALKEREDIDFFVPDELRDYLYVPGEGFIKSDNADHPVIRENNARFKIEDTLKHIQSRPDLYPEFQNMTVDSVYENVYKRALESMGKGQEISDRSTMLGTVGGFLGSSGAMVTDPEFAGVMFTSLVATKGLGGFTTQSLGRQMLIEGIVGAGAEAYTQFTIMDWYKELGIDYTYKDFFSAVATGGLIGSSLPPAFKGVGTGVRLTSDQVKKGLDVFAEAGYIPRKDADAAIHATEGVEALTSGVPLEAIMPDTFMEKSPPVVRPIRTEDELDIINFELDDLRMAQTHMTMDDLYAKAPGLQDDLVATGARIQADLGVTFKNPGIKELATSQEKMVRRKYKDTRQLTDVVRGGFLVNTAKQADEVVAKLAESYKVIDEGWQITNDGYFDRKVAVVFNDGTVGEVQIWSPKVFEAKTKKGGGHDLYTKARSETDADKHKALVDEMRKLYAKALRGEHQSFTNLVGILKDPNLREKIRRKASAEEITAAVDETSIASTSSQSPPGSIMATASEASDITIAGRPSQDVKTGFAIGDTPVDMIGEQAFSVKNFIAHQARAEDAINKLDQGLTPDETPGNISKRPMPEETMVEEPDVQKTIDQIEESSDFANMADDEVLYIDAMEGDEPITRQMTGAEVKAELARDEAMIDSLSRCVIR